MKIAIFGSTGGTGRELINQALAAGHTVVAYARNPDKIGVENARLTTVKGELSDSAAIERAIAGADAVISALGPATRPVPGALTTGAKNIVGAMQKSGVRRLIFASTPSATDASDKSKFLISLAIFMVKTLLRAAYDDIRGAADVIRGSDRDWTLVRIITLNNKPKDGQIALGYVGDRALKMSVSRANLAAFMLAQASDAAYLRKSPVITDA